MSDQPPKVITYKNQRVWLEPEHRIIMAEFGDATEMDIEDARRSTKLMIEITNGEQRPLLVDFKHLKSQTKECREYYAKDPEHVKTYSAVAILVGSPLTRVIANFFMGINKPVRPTRLFEDRDRALEWLKQFA